jgi:hypothetical protein
MKTLVVFPNKELLYAASTLGGEVAALVFKRYGGCGGDSPEDQRHR